MKVAGRTTQIWGFAMAFLAVILAMSAWNLLPFTLTLGFVNGIVLLILGLTLLSESVWEGKFTLRSPLSAIGLLVSLSAFVLAVVSFGFYTLPPAISGASGYLYVLLALFIVIELFRR